MGCASSIEAASTIKTVEHMEANNNLLFTNDERLKLKEVWIIVKRHNLKKLGDDIVSRASERSSTLFNYWENIAGFEQTVNLTFTEGESVTDIDLLRQQSFYQHGYKLLEKIDQLIIMMVTRTTITDIDDKVFDEYFQAIAKKHAEFKIEQDHVDVIRESLLECLKNLMDHNDDEWTTNHEVAWMKLFTLITNRCFSSTSIAETNTVS